MKDRRAFFKTTSSAIIGSAFLSLPAFSSPGNLNKKGIVRKADEGETYFVRENTALTIKVSKKVDGVDSISICTEEIQPGGGIPIHKHLNEDESFYFHKGSGIFLLEDEEFAISEGSSALVPKGTWHGLKNTGGDLIIFTFGYSPAGFEDFFRQIGTIKGTPFMAKSKEEIQVISKKYGMVFK